MSKLGFDQTDSHETWLRSVDEPILEAQLPIIDAHHHLWYRPEGAYLFDDLLADLAMGPGDESHNVVATVFAECHSMYRADGPQALRSVGESEFVAGVAAMSDSGNYGDTKVCAAMFGGADLTLGDAVEPVLDAHIAASGNRFRGVRLSCGWDPSGDIRNVADRAEMLADPAVRAAVGVLARRGLSLDVWLYHPQLDELAALADTFEDLTIILNHVGSPILGGPYRDRRDEVMRDWRAGIENVAQRENVVMKLGALPIRLTADQRARSEPPGSEEVAAAWAPWMDVCIDAFGPARCMFESNFPVQKNWCSYSVVWNAYKRIAATATDTEKADLFAGTARRAYRMAEPEPA